MGNVQEFFTGLHAKLYKLTGGKLTGSGSLIIVRHVGARSGRVRESPIMGFRDGDAYFVAASANGSPKNPGWYYNLLAHPETIINDSGKEIPVTASDAGVRRDELWQKAIEQDPRFRRYEKKTDRAIPIIVLTPR